MQWAWIKSCELFYCWGLWVATKSLYSDILSRVCCSFSFRCAISALTFFRVSRICSSDFTFFSSTKKKFNEKLLNKLKTEKKSYNQCRVSKDHLLLAESC